LINDHWKSEILNKKQCLIIAIEYIFSNYHHQTKQNEQTFLFPAHKRTKMINHVHFVTCLHKSYTYKYNLYPYHMYRHIIYPFKHALSYTYWSIDWKHSQLQPVVSSYHLNVYTYKMEKLQLMRTRSIQGNTRMFIWILIDILYKFSWLGFKSIQRFKSLQWPRFILFNFHYNIFQIN